MSEFFHGLIKHAITYLRISRVALRIISIDSSRITRIASYLQTGMGYSQVSQFRKTLRDLLEGNPRLQAVLSKVEYKLLKIKDLTQAVNAWT